MRKWYQFSAISVVLFFAIIPILGQNIDRELFGIDISHHNGNVNWKQVSIVEFVYIKATERATGVPMIPYSAQWLQYRCSAKVRQQSGFGIVIIPE